MGYACPVCETPQRDGEHLAHHLAFTAMLHGDDHEAWLDAHAPDWGERDPAGLAATVTAHADHATYHEVFEDTTDRGRPAVDHGRGHGHGHDHDGRPDPDPDPHASHSASTDMTPDTAAIVAEARELTRAMYVDGDGGGDGDGDGDPADDTNPADDTTTDA